MEDSAQLPRTRGRGGVSVPSRRLADDVAVSVSGQRAAFEQSALSDSAQRTTPDAASNSLPPGVASKASRSLGAPYSNTNASSFQRAALDEPAIGVKRSRRQASGKAQQQSDNEDEGLAVSYRGSSGARKNAGAGPISTHSPDHKKESRKGIVDGAALATGSESNLGPLPKLSAAGYTSYGGAYDFEAALNMPDEFLCTGDPKAIIPGSTMTEGEFARLSSEEQKKQRRLIRNRFSAQMHRQRQRAHLDALETQVTELAYVIDEMRSRLLSCASACTCGSVTCCEPASAAGKEAKQAGRTVIPPALLSYSPPHIPGLLGYTGVVGERVDDLRAAVMKGLLGPGGGVHSTSGTLTGAEGVARMKAVCAGPGAVSGAKGRPSASVLLSSRVSQAGSSSSSSKGHRDGTVAHSLAAGSTLGSRALSDSSAGSDTDSESAYGGLGVMGEGGARTGTGTGSSSTGESARSSPVQHIDVVKAAAASVAAARAHKAREESTPDKRQQGSVYRGKGVPGTSILYSADSGKSGSSVGSGDESTGSGSGPREGSASPPSSHLSAGTGGGGESPVNGHGAGRASSKRPRHELALPIPTPAVLADLGLHLPRLSAPTAGIVEREMSDMDEALGCEPPAIPLTPLSFLEAEEESKLGQDAPALFPVPAPTRSMCTPSSVRAASTYPPLAFPRPFAVPTLTPACSFDVASGIGSGNTPAPRLPALSGCSTGSVDMLGLGGMDVDVGVVCAHEPGQAVQAGPTSSDSTGSGNGFRLGAATPAGLLFGSLALLGVIGTGLHAHSSSRPGSDWGWGGVGDAVGRRLSSQAHAREASVSGTSALASLWAWLYPPHPTPHALTPASLSNRLDRTMSLLESAAQGGVQEGKPPLALSLSVGPWVPTVQKAEALPAVSVAGGVGSQGTVLRLPTPFTTRGVSLRASTSSAANASDRCSGAASGALVPLSKPMPATLELRLPSLSGTSMALSGQIRGVTAAGERMGKALARLIRLAEVQAHEVQTGVGGVPLLGSTSSSLPDLPVLRVSETRLVHALQAYADAALVAYERASEAAARVRARARAVDDEEQEGASSPASSASFVVCPDPIASMAGLGKGMAQRTHAGTSAYHTGEEEAVQVPSGPGSRPDQAPGRPVRLAIGSSTESQGDGQDRADGDIDRGSGPPTRPFLLLMVPGDTLAVPSMGKGPRIDVRVQEGGGGVGNASSTGTSSSGAVVNKVNGTGKEDEQVNSSSEEEGQSGSSPPAVPSSGWLEVGCEVVSLRRVAGLGLGKHGGSGQDTAE